MPDPLIGVFRGLPASDYHSRPGASPSKLRHFHGTTPAHAKLVIDTPVEPTPGMILGTLAHAAALEPDKPLPGIVMVPKEYPETEKPIKRLKEPPLFTKEERMEMASDLAPWEKDDE